ncbi:hypothetical protein QBB33_40920 [Streptomyces scabiei]|uniref:hypothetical protein n=1 Tax=Streptomyces scabiei TaxID=1930 RepID=UPI001B305198|nr:MULTISPECIES: hypothetical protein [Streptomyces]MBP5872735.1 hypothetical protein [Streptomyces sp. LBUM 1485]MBP5911867.1 hypothetical protein [Streptomyces sp. LBUM 1486]MDX3027826.1 hypothetical protein [Streptomyces scabiei]MDX3206474.1 hypothetical protein [Streptomyces scabiei]QTU58625.1 hypothetical protein F3K21_42735 [Streptomyces sp. LBUM 1480]
MNTTNTTTPSFRVRRLTATGVLATLVLAGCGTSQAAMAPGRNSSTPKALPDICAASTQRNGIVHCTKPFPGTKPIRLPADPSGTQRYGALKRHGTKFHTRGGDLPLAAAVARQLTADVEDGRTAYANTIYLATISKGTVTTIKPVADIDENAVLQAAFAGRAMEGTIGVRTRQGDYASDATLPVRIELAKSPVHGELTGRITNATKAVRSAKGSCLAPLNRTEANPLVGGFTARITLERYPSMHVAYDDELVLRWKSGASNMGHAYYPSIATLLGGDPLGRTWQAGLHGTPTAGPRLDLRLVSGGGGTC